MQNAQVEARGMRVRRSVTLRLPLAQGGEASAFSALAKPAHRRQRSVLWVNASLSINTGSLLYLTAAAGSSRPAFDEYLTREDEILVLTMVCIDTWI